MDDLKVKMRFLLEFLVSLCLETNNSVDSEKKKVSVEVF